MDTIINKIRQHKPDKAILYSEEGTELVIALVEKTPQQIRSILNAENPVKVRLLKADDVVFSWNAGDEDLEAAAAAAAAAAACIPPAAPGAVLAGAVPDYAMFLRLMIEAQNAIGNQYERMMRVNAVQIDTILSTQTKVIKGLESKLEKMDERLSDSLDLNMANSLPDETTQTPATPPAAVPDDMLNQIMTLVAPLLANQAGKKE